MVSGIQFQMEKRSFPLADPRKRLCPIALILHVLDRDSLDVEFIRG